MTVLQEVSPLLDEGKVDDEITYFALKNSKSGLLKCPPSVAMTGYNLLKTTSAQIAFHICG